MLEPLLLILSVFSVVCVPDGLIKTSNTAMRLVLGLDDMRLWLIFIITDVESGVRIGHS